MQNKRGLILFTRLPDYFYQCLQYYAEHFNCSFDVVRYPADTSTTFEFQPNEKINLYNRNEIDASQLIGAKYDFVYSSSWRDKMYKSVCRQYRNHVPVIIGLDNPWLGSIKQWIHVLLSPFMVKPFFNRIWVAGSPQQNYAQKLGYSTNHIADSLYSCDNDKFFHIQDVERECTILFVGRFVAYKQPVILAAIFQELLEAHPELKRWKLKFVGRGPLQEALESYASENIFIQDFTAPEKLPDLFRKASFFCLPSENEHWGLVVHEAASCGMPLLLSDTVHSGTAFLSPGENGFMFRTGNREDFKQKLFQALNSSAEALDAMRIKSAELSGKISKASWAAALNKLIYVDKHGAKA